MEAHQIAKDVWRIALVRLDVVNAYIVGKTLIDSGGRFARGRLLRFLDAKKLSAHVLTHGHPDHQGCSHAVCARFGIPLFCGEGDREAQESGNLARLMPHPATKIARMSNILGGPAHPVSRALSEGDDVEGFAVIETPGHTPGHLAFWREADRLLILGDVLFHRNPATLRMGLAEPTRIFTHNRQSNLASARKLAALEPEVICFGHGAPLKDGEAFCRFVEGLTCE
jgi:hydroxyacylglutathione hydrolase